MRFSLESRKKHLLMLLIEKHIEDALPVGSARLASEYNLEWSPATIRAELLELEEDGFLTHPHTSAGRVPTEKGYKFYVDEIIFKNDFASNGMADELHKMEALLRAHIEMQNKMRSFVKACADMTGTLSAVMRKGAGIYFTGINKLFTQTEFMEDPEMRQEVSESIDDIEETISEMENKLEESKFDTSKDIDVLIGSDNPFGNMCSSVIARIYKTNKDENAKSAEDLGAGFIVFVGPMRMNYRKTIFFADAIRKLADMEENFDYE